MAEQQNVNCAATNRKSQLETDITELGTQERWGKNVFRVGKASLKATNYFILEKVALELNSPGQKFRHCSSTHAIKLFISIQLSFIYTAPNDNIIHEKHLTLYRTRSLNIIKGQLAILF